MTNQLRQDDVDKRHGRPYIVLMATTKATHEELASLDAIRDGDWHDTAHDARLIALGLAYEIDGHLFLNAAGREALAAFDRSEAARYAHEAEEVANERRWERRGEDDGYDERALRLGSR